MLPEPTRRQRPEKRHRSPAIGALLGVLALTCSLVFMAGTVAASDGATAGHLVLPADGDVAMPYKTLSGAAICYLDMDGSGNYNLEDSVVLAVQNGCSGNSDVSDIRLVEWADRPAGDRLGLSPDQGIALQSLTPAPKFVYFDHDNDATFSPGDGVYLRMNNADLAQVRAGDIRITASEGNEPGTLVRATDEDFARSVASLGTASVRIRHVDLMLTSTFSSRDHLYLSADTDREAAALGDVRIYNDDAALPFGSFVQPGDPEPQDTIRTISRYVCTVQKSASGAYTPGDPLYLSVGTECTGTVAAADIRLSNNTQGTAGSRVAAGDGDHGDTYVVLPDARLGYVDNDGDGNFGRTDLAVIRIDDAQTNTLHAGDLLLSPTNRDPGAVLLAGDPLIGTPIRDLGPVRDAAVFKSSTGTTTPGPGDPFYLSPSGVTGQGLKPNDIRLVQDGDHQFGSPVGLDTGDLRSKLTRATSSVCSTNAIPGDYQPGHPVYLRIDGACPNSVTTGLLRLVDVDDHKAFSTVRSADSDIGRTLLTPSGTPAIRYYTIGEAGWGYTTRAYLNIVSPGEDAIKVGDIRLTAAGEGTTAGTPVLGGDSDRNVGSLSQLGSISGRTGYIDIDGSGTFTPGDHAYVTPTTSHEYVTPLTLRLTPLPAPFEPLTVQEPATGNGEDGTPDPTNGDTPDESETATPDPQGEEEEGSPAAPVVVVVFIVGIVMAGLRRRR